MSLKKEKILVVGQTPPPFHGQAIMIENMLKGNYELVRLYHVRMAFSKEIEDVGKVGVHKIFHLFEVIFKIIYSKIFYGISTLYFPPTGPNRIPFYRDALVLIFTRPFFKKVIFHFHGAGISELYPKLDPLSRFIFRRAYFDADVGIRLSRYTTDDNEKLKVSNEFIVPYGIQDNFPKHTSVKSISQECTILFVGLLNESKGILVLIEACGILKKKGASFKVNVLGKFESEKFEFTVKALVKKLHLDSEVTFWGVVTGDQKFAVYASSDMFCFPTYYETESFPVVLLEALSFGLPVVTTRWRGIPSIINDGINGYLAEIKDPVAIAQKLELLINDSTHRISMGQVSRQTFLEKYTIDKFYTSIEHALTST